MFITWLLTKITFVGPWSNWSVCSVSCGNGTKYRTRTCITDCENGTIQYKECYMGCCPGNQTEIQIIHMCVYKATSASLLLVCMYKFVAALCKYLS